LREAQGVKNNPSVISSTSLNLKKPPTTTTTNHAINNTTGSVSASPSHYQASHTVLIKKHF
jgi:hypothetical protein